MGKLYEHYHTQIRPQLQKDLGISNPMAVPKITKVTLNMGVGEAIADRKVMEAAVTEMTAIAGQQPGIHAEIPGLLGVSVHIKWRTNTG